METAMVSAWKGHLVMPMVQSGPPQWVWERTADPLKWEVVPVKDPKGHTVYELRVDCGLEIMRLQFFMEDEIRDLQSLIDKHLGSRAVASGSK
jgi:hypothetical protein